MRVMIVLGLTGCFAHDPECGARANPIVAALGAAAFVAGALLDHRPEPEEPDDPPPTEIRDYWRGPALACREGRTIHLRCVRARSGQSCFWETDEGMPFDCPDDGCKTIPADLAAWCY